MNYKDLYEKYAKRERFRCYHALIISAVGIAMATYSLRQNRNEARALAAR